MIETFLNIYQIFSIFVLIIISLLICFEFFFRFVNFLKYKFFVKLITKESFFDKNYHKYLHWTNSWEKPMFYYFPTGLRFHNINNKITSVKYNKYGFRCDEFEKIKDLDDEYYKILFTGSSAGWGFGSSSDSSTISAYLEKFLNLNINKKFKVINLCQVNNTQTQDIQILSWLMPILKPNLVIHFGGWNELIGSARIDLKYIHDYDMMPVDEMLDWVPIQASNNAFTKMIEGLMIILKKKSIFFNFINKFFSNKKKTIEFKRSLKKNVELVSDVYNSNLQRLDKLIKSYNSKSLHVFQPNIFRKNNYSESEKKILKYYKNFYRSIGDEKDMDYLKENNIFKKIIELSDFKELKIDTLDLSDVFINYEDACFHSLVHCNDKGYEIIAKKIFDFIRKT